MTNVLVKMDNVIENVNVSLVFHDLPQAATATLFWV
jgi:hypothetical protein